MRESTPKLEPGQRIEYEISISAYLVTPVHRDSPSSVRTVMTTRTVTLPSDDYNALTDAVRKLTGGECG